MGIIRNNPIQVMLAAIVVICLMSYFCYHNPDCAVCQFLEAFN